MLEKIDYNTNIAAQEVFQKSFEFINKTSPSLKADIIEKTTPPPRVNFFDTYA